MPFEVALQVDKLAIAEDRLPMHLQVKSTDEETESFLDSAYGAFGDVNVM